MIHVETRLKPLIRFNTNGTLNYDILEKSLMYADDISSWMYARFNHNDPFCEIRPGEDCYKLFVDMYNSNSIHLKLLIKRCFCDLIYKALEEHELPWVDEFFKFIEICKPEYTNTYIVDIVDSGAPFKFTQLLMCYPYERCRYIWETLILSDNYQEFYCSYTAMSQDINLAVSYFQMFIDSVNTHFKPDEANDIIIQEIKKQRNIHGEHFIDKLRKINLTINIERMLTGMLTV